MSVNNVPLEVTEGTITHVLIVHNVLVIQPLACKRLTETNDKPLSNWSVRVNQDNSVSSGMVTSTRNTIVSHTATLVHEVIDWSVDNNVFAIVGANVNVVVKESLPVYHLSCGIDQESVLRVHVTTFTIPVLYAIPVITFVWNITCENAHGASIGYAICKSGHCSVIVHVAPKILNDHDINSNHLRSNSSIIFTSYAGTSDVFCTKIVYEAKRSELLFAVVQDLSIKSVGIRYINVSVSLRDNNISCVYQERSASFVNTELVAHPYWFDTLVVYVITIYSVDQRSVSLLTTLQKSKLNDQLDGPINAPAIIHVLVYHVAKTIHQETAIESILTRVSHEEKLSIIIIPDSVVISGTAIFSVNTASSPATTVFPVVSATDVVSNCFVNRGESKLSDASSTKGSHTKFGPHSILEYQKSTHVFT